MAALPTGTVTFLFTDVEGSTRLWETDLDAAREALIQHDAIVEFLTEQHHGCVVRPRGEGDSRFCVFARATDGVAAAAAIQRALQAEVWPTPEPLRVRIALHTGEADLREGDYYGTAVNRCARLRAVAHGGQTLLSQATADLTRERLREGLALRDLGEQRLRDRTAPERVYELIDPTRPRDFPPLRSLDALPNNLPAQLTAFVGREREIAEVVALLDQARLVTLTGTGGCGKTRLALQVAADLLERYPDGAWFVDLAPVADGGLVPPAALGALGMRDQSGRPPIEVLTERLREREALLVLDNCEHLVEACARLADALLRACPRQRILATSREMLGIAGERAWRVPSLAVPAGGEPLAELGAYASVRLFAERARAVEPAFRLTEASAAAVAQICRRLDGIPLAIELAAARARVLPPEQIAARLDDRFRLLTGGSRTALRRQQTLQALVDWSHDLLTDAERALFCRLAVFAGGWTLDAAEAVCVTPSGEVGEEEVLDLLTGLVDKSLVVSEGDGGQERYRFLETIRQYAGEKLFQSGEAPAVRDRHLAWGVELVERAHDELTGPDRGAWVRRLDVEIDNLRAALAWGFETPHDSAPVVRLAIALGAYWRDSGSLVEGRDWLERAVAASADAPAADRLPVLRTAASVAWRGGDLARGRALIEAALALAPAAGDRRVEAETLIEAGHVAFRQGDGAAAGQWCDAGLRLSRQIGDRDLVARAVAVRGGCCNYLGDFAAARRDFEESLPIWRETGNLDLLSMGLSQLGWAMLGLRDLAAESLLLESLEVTRRIGARRSAGFVLRILARLERARGRLDAAAARLAEGIALSYESGDHINVEVGLRDGAGLAAEAGDHPRAARLLGGADAVRARFGLPVHAGDRPTYERLVAEMCRALGEAAFATAWAAGRAMPLGQAVSLAQGGVSVPTRPASPRS